MKIKSLIGTSFVFYLILMIGFNEPALAAIVWSVQTSPTINDLEDVSAVDDMTAWAVGAGGRIVHTTDGGTTWSAQSTSSNMLGISAVDANTAWAVGNDGTILYTTDGGVIWNPQSSGTTQPLLAVSAVDDMTAWAVGNGGIILKTINAGTTWSAQTSGTSNGLRDVSAVNANTVWALAGSFMLYTMNGGATWSQQTTGPSNILRGVSAADDMTVWTVGWTGKILKTTNAGTTWSAQTSGTTLNLLGVSAVDDMTAWAVGAGGTILYTTDAGATWSAQTSGTSNDLRDVSAVDANIAWAVGDSGTILKGVETPILIADLTINGACEVDLASASIIFLNGNPISNGAGVGTGEISEVLTNTLGNLQSSTSAYVTDWTDGGALTIMDGSHTVFSTSSGGFGSKTGLSTDDQNPTSLGNIAPQDFITIYLDLEIVLDGGNPGFVGAAEQTFTFDFTCV